jgi:hypothetical protein
MKAKCYDRNNPIDEEDLDVGKMPAFPPKGCNVKELVKVINETKNPPVPTEPCGSCIEYGNEKCSGSCITPLHYDYRIQPVEFIEANNLGFSVGNIIKYACRYNKKGTPIEDLDKIIHYANILKDKLNW